MHMRIINLTAINAMRNAKKALNTIKRKELQMFAGSALLTCPVQPGSLSNIKVLNRVELYE